MKNRPCYQFTRISCHLVQLGNMKSPFLFLIFILFSFEIQALHQISGYARDMFGQTLTDARCILHTVKQKNVLNVNINFHYTIWIKTTSRE
jgi:hypothetical protein